MKRFFSLAVDIVFLAAFVGAIAFGAWLLVSLLVDLAFNAGILE